MGASVQKDGEAWTLILVRELRHPPGLVWQALTDPTQLAEWAPFEANRNLGAVGPVTLSTVGTPMVADGTVKRAEEPRMLEYTWGGKDLRWELHATSAGTRLTLWHNIDRGFISWGAAGWHVCFDVLERLIRGNKLHPAVFCQLPTRSESMRDGNESGGTPCDIGYFGRERKFEFCFPRPCIHFA